MEKAIQKERSGADRRFMQEGNPAVICTSIVKSGQRPCKRVARHTHDDPCKSRSRQPFSNPQRTDAEIEEIVVMEVQPVPSLSTISRIICRRDLTHCRTGRYEADEKASSQS
jgi:putative transposase